MNKTILTPQKAQEIQNKIYYKMSASKKVRLTSMFFVLARELNKKYGTRRTVKKNS
jgi:hypothetical protein